MLTSLETREADEAAMTTEMIDILRRKMARDYDAGQTRRDAHPKTTGLLRGRFEVEDDLPQHLRVGVFAKTQTYDCWIRTSNSSGKPQSDAIGDARGFAIKLMAPGGKRKDETPLGQDFVLLSTPVMPLGTIALFRDAVYYTIESSPLLFAAKCVLGGHTRALLGLVALRIRPTSPLDIQYWSTTPYRFGKGRAVKYSLVPTSQHRSSMPTEPGDSYLSEAMQRHLDKHEASFDFCVQLRQDGMPIEDAAPRWDETASPFLKVATLRIPKQKFRSAQRDALAESLAFSPGHALPAHVPMGGLNRARIKIYKALSKFRHTRDARAEIA
ncbi:MAG: catalase [Xanthomonadales bacterium]|nr:catalase [Xanthomonadales bacterium]